MKLICEKYFKGFSATLCSLTLGLDPFTLHACNTENRLIDTYSSR